MSDTAKTYLARLRAASQEQQNQKESNMAEQAKCGLCGEPMPAGEEMFQYHGYSGPCPAKATEPIPDPKLQQHWEEFVRAGSASQEQTPAREGGE